jgi:hypothetical protein
MRVHTKIQYQWDGQEYVEVYEEGFDRPENGQVALCKGASDDQNNLAKSQADFYKTLSDDYNTQFANQSNILTSLQTSLQPVVNAGVNQFGYNPAEENALNSTAIQGTAQSYQNAQKALQNQQAAQGGGNLALPSGVAAQNNATLASAGANQESSELLGIKNAGYAQGRENYNNAIAQMGGVSAQYNPLGYSAGATGAGNSAASEANTIQQENQASSPWGAIGGLLGGVAGSFLGPMGASVGSKLGSSVGGFASGSGDGVLTASQTGLGG